jgi:hypothetical protein
MQIALNPSFCDLDDKKINYTGINRDKINKKICTLTIPTEIRVLLLLPNHSGEAPAHHEREISTGLI